MQVHISGQKISMPRRCVCCGGDPDTQRSFSAAKTTGKKTLTRIRNMKSQKWDFPFCNHCIEHDKLTRKYMGSLGYGYAVGVILLVGAYFFRELWPLAVVCVLGAVVSLGLAAYRTPAVWRKTKALRYPNCASPYVDGLVRYIGWSGSVHSFDIKSEDYAIALMRVNRPKLVNVPIEVLRIVDN